MVQSVRWCQKRFRLYIEHCMSQPAIGHSVLWCQCLTQVEICQPKEFALWSSAEQKPRLRPHVPGVGRGRDAVFGPCCVRSLSSNNLWKSKCKAGFGVCSARSRCFWCCFTPPANFKGSLAQNRVFGRQCLWGMRDALWSFLSWPNQPKPYPSKHLNLNLKFNLSVAFQEWIKEW